MASIRYRVSESGTKRWQVREKGLPSKTFGVKADAEKYRRELERRKALGTLYVAPPESFEEAFNSYLDKKRAQGRNKATIRLLKELQPPLKALMPRQVSSIRRAEVEDMIYAYANTAPRRAQQALALLKSVLKQAKARGQVIDEGILAIDQPRYEERKAMFLTVEQVWELATWMPDWIQNIVPIAAFTGMRQGELFALVEDDLRLQERRLFVRAGKTEAATRTVYLSREIVALFEQQLKVRAPSRYVFPTSEGLMFDGKNFMGRYYRPATRAAGLDGLRFHDLRHTAVSLMARADWRVERIAKQIGHKDGGALLLRRYRHVFEDEMHDDADRFDQFLLRTPQPVMDRSGTREEGEGLETHGACGTRTRGPLLAKPDLRFPAEPTEPTEPAEIPARRPVSIAWGS